MIKFSAVVPVYNEANNLVKLHKELLDVLERLALLDLTTGRGVGAGDEIQSITISEL